MSATLIYNPIPAQCGCRVETKDPFYIIDGEYAVWSILYQRYFYGSTLKLARINRKMRSEQKIDRNDYEHDPIAEEFYVYSAVLERCFCGQTLTQARANRDTAEQVYYRHHKYDLYPVED